MIDNTIWDYLLEEAYPVKKDRDVYFAIIVVVFAGIPHGDTHIVAANP